MGFLEPHVWAEQYLMEESHRYAKQQLFEDEMSRYKTEAVKRFYIVANPIYAEQVAVTTAFGYENNIQEAEKIVIKLGLENKHIAALLDDKEMMEKLIFQDKLEEKMMGEIIFEDEDSDQRFHEHCFC